MKISKNNYALAILASSAWFPMQAAAASDEVVDVQRLFEQAVRVRVTMLSPYSSEAPGAGEGTLNALGCKYESSDPVLVRDLSRQFEEDRMKPLHADQLSFTVSREVEFQFADRAPVKMLLGPKNSMTNRARGSLENQQVLVDGALPRKVVNWVLNNDLPQIDKNVDANCHDLNSWI